jgi:son of sevenless-like protein
MSHLDPLSELSDPTTNYAQLRKVLASVDGPCIPFLGMYLDDLVHINDQVPDVLSGNPPLINFSKRQNLADAASAIVRHQAKPHLYREVSSFASSQA